MIRIVRFTPEYEGQLPAPSATRLGKSNIWKVFFPHDQLHPNAVELANSHAAISEIPKKKSLPVNHPLYDKRLIEPVLSGMHDIEMKSDGSFVHIINGIEYPYGEEPGQ